MVVLQTWSCPKLVMILAMALQKQREKGIEGIINIKQFEDVSLTDRMKCDVNAEILIKMIPRSYQT